MRSLSPCQVALIPYAWPLCSAGLKKSSKFPLPLGTSTTGSGGQILMKTKSLPGISVTGLIYRFTSISADPRNNGSGNLEETARHQRYEFLSEIASRDKKIIATGHNSDDQAETFLLNLLRGAGYKGLSAMLPSREHRDESGKACTVIRPLLHVNRKQIIGYLCSTGQKFRIDDSNADQAYDRNWIRHELLPLLGKRFNPGPGDRIARASELIGEAAQFLEEQAETKLNEIAETSGAGSLLLPVNKMQPLREVLQREVVRLAISRIKGNLTDLTSRHIYAVMELMSGQSGKSICLPERIEARREFDMLVIGLPATAIPYFEYRLDIPGNIYIPQVGKHVTIELLPGPSSAGSCRKPDQAVIIRNRRPGDRLKISAGRPRQAFSNLCTEFKIPGAERDQILIIELPGASHWVEGIGMPGKIAAGAKTEIIISVSKVSNN